MDPRAPPPVGSVLYHTDGGLFRNITAEGLGHLGSEVEHAWVEAAPSARARLDAHVREVVVDKVQHVVHPYHLGFGLGGSGGVVQHVVHPDHIPEMWLSSARIRPDLARIQPGSARIRPDLARNPSPENPNPQPKNPNPQPKPEKTSDLSEFLPVENLSLLLRRDLVTVHLECRRVSSWTGETSAVDSS
eukprot:3025018-Rhodomonas_salina.1